jgi:hypothetical protein
MHDNNDAALRRKAIQNERKRVQEAAHALARDLRADQPKGIRRASKFLTNRWGRMQSDETYFDGLPDVGFAGKTKAVLLKQLDELTAGYWPDD